MEIQKINSKQSLTHVKKALLSPMARNYNRNELIDVIGASVAKAFQKAGQTPEKEDSYFITSEVVKDVLLFYPNIRVEEIPIAIEKGLVGDFGNYFGINALSISKFLKAHMESEYRKKEAIELRKESEPTKQEPTKEERFEAETRVIAQAYNKFCEVGFYDDYGNFIYNKLDERGLIPFNTERKKEMFAKAKENLIRKNNPSNANNLGERNALKKALNLVLEGMEDANIMIATEAKKIALATLFAELQELGTSITDLLEVENEAT